MQDESYDPSGSAERLQASGSLDSEGTLGKLVPSSPISHLPPELLSLILQIAYSDDCDAPVHASQVSQFWREVATGTPQLWYRINICIPWDAAAIETKLTRSKEYPLDISIIVPYLDSTFIQERGLTIPSPQAYEALSDLISPSLSRCRSLDIQGRFEHCEYGLLKLLEPLRSMAMPYLEKFVLIERDDFQQLPVASWFGNMFTDTPKLTELRLGGFGLSRCTLTVSTVTTLHLVAPTDQVPYADFALMLESCSSLSFLALYDNMFRDDWPDNSAICHLPHLETLYILGNMLTVSELLLHITAPNLHLLVIAPATTHDFALFYSQHPRFEQPRFPLLRSLTLAPSPRNSVGIFEIASSCFPGISRLVITNPNKRQFEIFGDPSTQLFRGLQDLALNLVRDGFLPVLDSILTFGGASNIPSLQNIYIDTPSLQQLSPGSRKWGPARKDLVEANIWEEQRLSVMYSDDEERFILHPDDSEDSDDE